MDSSGIVQGTIAAAQSRAPLLSKPNSPLSTPMPAKQVRRMTSFVRRYGVDSSEELPSPHGSIYEAVSFSDDSSSRIEAWPMAPLRGISHKDGSGRVDENSRAIQRSMDDHTVDDSQFRYGNGTILETITEQKSNGTMRSLFRPRSAEDMHKIPVLKPARGPHRKRSFSLDDLELIHRSYHDACTMIEKVTHKPLLVHEIYAQAKVPVRGPLERPSTPPGMPSWTASQSQPTRPASGVAYHIPSPNRLQRFLGIEPSRISLSNRVPHLSLRCRAVSAPVREQMAPRFRPPRSAYSPIAQHPFNNAPIARVATPSLSGTTATNISFNPQSKPTRKCKPGQKVRFTHSATARDSEIYNLQNAIESSSDFALHPMAPLKSMEPMLPIPQLNTASANQKPCQHRTMRLSVPTILKHNNSKAPKSLHTISAPCSQNQFLDSPPPLLPSTIHLTSTISPATRCNPIESPLSSPISATSSRPSSGNSNNLIIMSSQTICTNSVSSIAHLMSGALSTQTSVARESLPPSPTTTSALSEIAQHPPQPKRTMSCWRCFINRWIERAMYWIDMTTSCLCFVCCGYDCDDDFVPYSAENRCRGFD